MKKHCILLLFLTLPLFLNAQIVNSDCTIPQVLIDNYDWDIKGLALDRMIETGHPGLDQVNIPQSIQDSIAEGLAAIFNADILPQRDSVFNMYCVHNGAFQPITHGIIVDVDESYAWTEHWQNLMTQTGEPLMDYITSTYGLEIQSYSSFAVLETDELWNVNALSDSLELVPGVNYAEPNYWIGGAGRITYDLIDNVKYYDFSFEWNDCFDGCDNRHIWHYKVSADCTVEFLGTSDFGFFGVEALPMPLNCNITTNLENPAFVENDYRLYPNPTADFFIVKNVDLGKTIQLEIVNLAGQILLKEKVEIGSQIDVSAFDAGLYFVKIFDGKGTIEIEKIILK